jgi:hypothetical protein
MIEILNEIESACSYEKAFALLHKLMHKMIVSAEDSELRDVLRKVAKRDTDYPECRVIELRPMIEVGIQNLKRGNSVDFVKKCFKQRDDNTYELPIVHCISECEPLFDYIVVNCIDDKIISFGFEAC